MWQDGVVLLKDIPKARTDGQDLRSESGLVQERLELRKRLQGRGRGVVAVVVAAHLVPQIQPRLDVRGLVHLRARTKLEETKPVSDDFCGV